jgi:hypothetical protein
LKIEVATRDMEYEDAVVKQLREIEPNSLDGTRHSPAAYCCGTLVPVGLIGFF